MAAALAASTDPSSSRNQRYAPPESQPRVLEEPAAGHGVGWSRVMPSGSSAGPGTTAHTGSAVPITSQTTPGSTTPAPSVAAMSSPQPSTTCVDGSRPAASSAREPLVPALRAPGGRRQVAPGRCRRRRMLGDHSPVATSRSIEDEAFEGSTASSLTRARATKEPAGGTSGRVRALRGDAPNARRSSRPRGPDRDCSRSLP